MLDFYRDIQKASSYYEGKFSNDDECTYDN